MVKLSMQEWACKYHHVYPKGHDGLILGEVMYIFLQDYDRYVRWVESQGFWVE